LSHLLFDLLSNICLLYDVTINEQHNKMQEPSGEHKSRANRKRSFGDRAMHRLAEIWFTFFPPKN